MFHLANRFIPALLCCLTIFLGGFSSSNGKDIPSVTDLDTALKTAATEQKLVFIKFGRPTCGNCNALQELIDGKKLKLPESKYIFANINCDDSIQKKAFYSRYKVTGDTLPFVVITDSEGKMLVSRTGYGNEAEFDDLIKEAGKIARKSEQPKPATP